MDPSIFKLLEEDDEDESMHSKEEVDAFQASLIREIEGGNHSWSQQMKAQQQSVLANQDRELNPEDVSLSHHNQPQELLQPNPLCENHNMSVQRTHGVEQPVGSVNLGPTHLQVCELIRILIPQVDKDRGNQLPSLYYKFKSKEITKYRFLRKVRNIVGDRMTLWAVRKLQQQGDKGVKLPDGPNHYRESFTSADQSLIQSLTEDVSAKKSDTPGVHVNQLPSASLGILSSSATVHEFNNSERPTSLPLYSVPCQGPVTKDQSMSNEQTVAHVKQKLTGQSFDQVRKPCSLVRKDVSNVPMELSNNNPRRSNDDLVKQSSEMILSASTTHANFASASLKTQLDSSTMVNFSAPTATIPPGTIVRTIQGQKKTLEAQGSSLPPLSKRQKLYETSLAGSDKKLNDVTELSGINLMEEERELLSSLPKKNSRVFKSSRRVAHEEEGRTILQKGPLQRKLAEIMAKSGIKHIKNDVERCLSLCVEERMRELLCNIIRMSKQRTDPEKCRDRICITSDIRKQINEMNQKEKEEQERKHGGEQKLKNDTAKEDKRSEQVKANKEQAEKRAKAANDAALASVGGDNAFLKWKLMAEARQKPSSVLERNSKKISGGRRLGKKNYGSPKVVRSISVKDVIAVVEKEPQVSRSTLLYRLYNRICSDVPTQDMT
ncbi:transcription initiation factor TFIID subunit 4 isoform X1 [Raphanus sativus]|uniref:Transcription initiation factor TFIID subunit 4 isoform X1 n=2 Tax=Raphanus sativus TaxID=3726 RepID=A0A6J0P0N2_RAPSA|nr:transcription initiation factor TFIID subunit 4 isoform X1 [Raphanus sativus]